MSAHPGLVPFSSPPSLSVEVRSSNRLQLVIGLWATVLLCTAGTVLLPNVPGYGCCSALPALW
jgi:hypothetical protein